MTTPAKPPLAWLEDRALVALLLATAVLAAHLPGVLGGSFHFDDHHNLVENEWVRSLANVPRFFADPGTWSAEPDNVMYRPLQVASYALDFAVWGYRAGGWVLTNALLHAAVAVLVWRLAARIGLSPLAAALAGAVTALHPVHTEVVNYVSSRSESLAAVVMLLALHAHLSARAATGGTRVAWTALAAGLAALSLTAKETTALFFAAVAWMELVLGAPPRREGRAVGAPSSDGADPARHEPGPVPALRRVATGLPSALAFGAVYAAAFAAMMLLRKAMLGMATASVPLAETAAGADFRAGGSISILDNVFKVQSRVVVLYLQTLLRPAALNIDHDVSRAPFWTPAAVVSLGIHAGVAAWALVEARRGRRLLPLCVGWFWLFLAPSVAYPLNVVMNEHRLYLPGIAVSLLAGAALARVAAVLGARWGTARGAAAAAAPLLLFVPLCVQRGIEWHDDLVLWTKAVERAPGSARAHMHLGAAWHAAHSRQPLGADLTLLDRALAEYRTAERLHPDAYDTQLNLGNAWLERSRVSGEPADREAALEAFRRAGEIVGAHAYRPRFWRAVVLGEMGRFDEAIAIVRELRAGDDSGTTLYDDTEARLHRRRGDVAEAERLMLRVIAVKEPEEDAEPLLTLAVWRLEDAVADDALVSSLRAAGDTAGAEAARRRGEARLAGARELIDRALAIANRRTDQFRPFLHAARMLHLLGLPDAAEQSQALLASARKRGWTAEPAELAWVRGGPTPGAMRGTRGLPAYGRPR